MTKHDIFASVLYIFPFSLCLCFTFVRFFAFIPWASFWRVRFATFVALYNEDSDQLVALTFKCRTYSLSTRCIHGVSSVHSSIPGGAFVAAAANRV